MKKHTIKQHYFLTTGYRGGVKEADIYRGFVIRYFCDKGKCQSSVNEIRNGLRDEYGVSVPLYVLESILKRISQEHEEVSIHNDQVWCRTLSPSIREEAAASVKTYDEDVRLLQGTFNSYLKGNGYKGDISFTRVQALIESMHHIILDGHHARPDLSVTDKLFFEWLTRILHQESPADIFARVNRLLYAAFAHHYFTVFKVPNGKIGKLRVFLDTNILAYAMGLGGRANQLFAQEFLSLLRANRISSVISCESLHELSELLVHGTAPVVKLYRAENPDLATQIITNTRSAVSAVLSECLPTVDWDNSSLVTNRAKFAEWPKLFSGLSSYKTGRRPYKEFSDFSFDHDVNLVCLAGAYGPTSNIYEQKAVVATSDHLFAAWFADTIEKEFHAKFSPIIPVEQLTYFLWFEGNQENPGKFMANAWLFLIETIPFFRKDSLNNIYKVLTTLPDDRTVVPNYRSTYLLVLHKLGGDDPERIESMDDIEFISGIKGIGEDLAIAHTRIDHLETQLGVTRSELGMTKAELDKLREPKHVEPSDALMNKSALQEIGQWLLVVLRIVRKLLFAM